MPWLLLLACGGTPDGAEARVLHAQALQEIPASPLSGLQSCREVDDPALLHDCLARVALALSEKGQEEEARAVCGEMSDAPAWECHFQLAEQRSDASLCRDSGPLADNCRLHVYSRVLHDWIDAATPLDSVMAQAPMRMEAADLVASDPRPWSATWRWMLTLHPPLDRSLCREIDDPIAREACLFTGLSLFEDQLNQGRDRGLDLCEGELPSALAYVPDPDLDAILERRRTEDLCDPTAVREAPDAHLPGSGR